MDVNHRSYFNHNLPILIAMNLGMVDYVYYFLEKGGDSLLYNGVGIRLAFSVQLERENMTEKEYRELKDYLIEEYQLEFPYHGKFKEEADKYQVERYEELSMRKKKSWKLSLN